MQRDASRPIHADAGREQYAGQHEQKAPPPPVPFRIDSTGLSKENLPKPPTRHAQAASSVDSAAAVRKPKASLPPRLPPRQNSAASTDTASPASPSYAATKQLGSPQKSYLNQNALNRLGAAGVVVPGFGIGQTSDTGNVWRDEPLSMIDNSSDAATKKAPDLNELHSRFAKMSAASTPPESPAQGTTFADKQAAFRTASSFRNDPSSVTLGDARSAASTANNFRERHGEQAAAGWQGVNGLNKKYGIANKIGGFGSESSSFPVLPSPPSSPMASGMNPTYGKKPSPIPPKKLTGTNSSGHPPPPVPLASKPRT